MARWCLLPVTTSWGYVKAKVECPVCKEWFELNITDRTKVMYCPDCGVGFKLTKQLLNVRFCPV